MLAPLKVSVPAPVLVTAPVPEMTPDKLAVPVELVKVPLSAIASAPTVPLMSNVAPEATVVPPAVVPNPVEEVTASVPALTVVVPVYVLALLKVRTLVDDVSLVSAPSPEMRPDSVCVALDEYKKLAPLAMLIFWL